MNFGAAIELAKKGCLITRQGWNGKGMFIFQRPADKLNIDVLLGAKSIPIRVKDYFEQKHQPIEKVDSAKIEFTSYLCMKAADDTIVNGWLASQTDMIADDWQIFG